MRKERRLGALAEELQALADESRTDHHVGTAVDNRLHHRPVVLRVVLEIGILDDYDVAGRGSKAALDGGAFARVALVQYDANVRNGVQDLPRPIFRPVVDDHDLHGDWAKVDGLHALDRLGDRSLLVVS